MADNQVTIIGNLTREPELKVGKNGISRVSLYLASNRVWEHAGERREETTFCRVVSFAEMAEHANDSFSTGDRIIVHGRLSHRRYENEDGSANDVYEVIANDLGMSVKWCSLAEIYESQWGEGVPEAHNKEA